MRFVPAHDANGQGDLTFKTWVPDANFGTYAADTTGTEFGPDSGAASIAIVPVNDAPTVDTAASPSLDDVHPGDLPVPRTSRSWAWPCRTWSRPGDSDPEGDGRDVGVPEGRRRLGEGDPAGVPGLVRRDSGSRPRRTRFVGQAAALTFKAWDGKAVSLDKDDLTVAIV